MTRQFRLLTLAFAAVLAAVLPHARTNAQTAAPDATAAPAASIPAHQDGAPTAATAKSPAQVEAGEPRATTSVAEGKPRKPADRVDLDTTTVTGNRELPKVMYVVPWKKSDIGDLGGKPVNSLLDEVLAPVDRDVFRREVVYYQAVKADAAPEGAGHPAPQGEK